MSLSLELARRVDLEKNRRNNEILQQPLTKGEQRAIGRIAEKLIQLPLLHAARENSVESIKQRGLLPHAEGSLDDQIGHTMATDKQLGLDEYVFSSLGDSIYVRCMGKEAKAISIEADEILFSEKTIVSPYDIVFYDPLSDSAREEYFGAILSGKDWLEVLARNSLALLRTRKPSPVLPLEVSPLPDGSDSDIVNVGEVKYHGMIDPSKLSIVEKDVVIRQTLENGYIPANMILSAGIKYHPTRILLENDRYINRIQRFGAEYCLEMLADLDVQSLKKDWESIYEIADS